MRQLKWIGVVMVALAVVAAFRGAIGSDGQRAYDDMPTLTTVQEFEQKVESADRPVLVDFYATWCGPCHKLAPVIGSLAREYGDRVDFYRVDTDKADELTRKMNIQYIPAVFIYVNGEPTRKLGLASRETFAKALEEALRQTASSQ